MNQSTAFVAGATGYVGRETVRELCGQGIPTIAHIRADSGSKELWQEQFTQMGANPVVSAWDFASISNVLIEHSVTLVFALLGTTKSRAKQEHIAGDIYKAVDYDLTEILLNASVQHTPTPRFIYLSSVGASESSRSAYLNVRGRLERELRLSGLSYVAARPAIIGGAGRDDSRPMERLAAGVGDGLLQVAALLGAKNMRQHYRSTNSVELAQNLVRLALSEFAGVAQGAALHGPQH